MHAFGGINHLFVGNEMQRAPRPNSKPISPPTPPALEISDGLGFLTCSGSECSFDADADARRIVCGSSWDDDVNVIAGASPDPDQIGPTKDAQQQRRVRGKHGKLKKMSTKYRHQEESEREIALRVRARTSYIASHTLRVSQLLGSNGGEGHRKHLRALAKEAEKGARAAVDAAKEARFYQPEPLSPEFAFVVRVRNRCAAGLRLALPRGAGRALHRQGVEVRQCNDRALTVRELRRIGSSGLLLNALMQLTRLSNCPNPSAALMCRLILARVAARLVSHASPEVCFVVLRLSLIFLTLV